MPRSKEQHLTIREEDYRGTGPGEAPEVTERSFTSHEAFLRRMGRLGRQDAHIREETRTIVRLYGQHPQSGLFEGAGEQGLDIERVARTFRADAREAASEYETPEAKLATIKRVAKSVRDEHDGRLTEGHARRLNAVFCELRNGLTATPRRTDCDPLEDAPALTAED